MSYTQLTLPTISRVYALGVGGVWVVCLQAFMSRAMETAYAGPGGGAPIKLSRFNETSGLMQRRDMRARDALALTHALQRVGARQATEGVLRG